MLLQGCNKIREWKDGIERSRLQQIREEKDGIERLQHNNTKRKIPARADPQTALPYVGVGVSSNMIPLGSTAGRGRPSL